MHTQWYDYIMIIYDYRNKKYLINKLKNLGIIRNTIVLYKNETST